jgi:hypothetical protein
VRDIDDFFNNAARPTWALTAVTSMAGDASPSVGRLWKPPRDGARCGVRRWPPWWRVTSSPLCTPLVMLSGGLCLLCVLCTILLLFTLFVGVGHTVCGRCTISLLS